MNAILYCGAIPVFADVNSDTFLMDPDDVERKVTEKTRAIMPVHLYGQVCDMSAIMSVAQRHRLAVVEDCAQCYLGTHKGRIGGTIGNVGSWSFENSKHLTTGDGGIIACDDEDLGDRIRRLCCQGFRNATAVSGKIRVGKDIFQNPAFKRHNMFGFMYRLPEVAAAMGLAQLEKLDGFVEKREMMAGMYAEAIHATGCPWLAAQKTPAGDRNSYYTFAARFLREDVPWEVFRKKYVELGGDGIYAAWTLCYLEDSVADVQAMLTSIGLEGRLNASSGLCPTAERIQKQLMQFTTNQKNKDEMKKQAESLYNTIRYFS